jgi:hypothetical protein
MAASIMRADEWMLYPDDWRHGVISQKTTTLKTVNLTSIR